MYCLSADLVESGQIYHCLSANLVFIQLSQVIIVYCLSADLVEFSDEEGYGKYLDLHECYVKYVNLKGIEVCYICALLSLLCKI